MLPPPEEDDGLPIGSPHVPTLIRIAGFVPGLEEHNQNP